MKDSINVVKGAVKIVRDNFIGDEVLYNCFVSSIASALKELPRESDLEDVAKAVADRIIGREE